MGDLSLAPRPREALSCLPWLLWIARFAWRMTENFLFMLVRFVVRLAVVTVICVMATQLLAVAIVGFFIVSNVSWWMFPLYRFTVVFCTAL